VWTGSALTPLGALGTGAALGSLIYGLPGRCTLAEDDCNRLLVSGYAGIGSSILMLGAGIGLLGAGLVQRARHRAWKRERNLAQPRWRIDPWNVSEGSSFPSGLRLHVTF
jgi:hypothetical protein